MLTMNTGVVLVLLGLSVICLVGRWLWDRSRPETIADGYSPSEAGIRR